MNLTEQRRELTSWVSAQTVDDLSTWPFDSSSVPMPERLGRYRIARLIGAGGMGAVYHGSADGFSSPVAIKTLRRLSPTGLLGLKQEFRRTRALSHPNLVSLYELGQDSGTWFFSMEFVQGVSLLHYAWGGETFSSVPAACERLLRLSPQLLDAISYLHQNNVLHLDIKPSNILVTPSGIPKLLDFGLSEAEFSSEHSGSRGAFAGTPAYMAPEQLWGRHSKACDAYALGVTLFETALGRLPLAAQLETLLTKQTKPAPKVSDVSAEVPPHLARVIDALLERDPERRMSVEEATLALGTQPSFASAPPPPVSTVLVGREAEVGHLAHWLALAEDGVVVGAVFGDSGVGKTTLLTASKQRWQAAGAWVLSSRCFEWQSISFKAADSLIDELFEHVRPLAPDLALPADLSLATSTFPVLAGLPLEPAPGRPTDKHLERERALDAIAHLLAELCQRQRVVLCVDDAQWGDVESAELIARCAERVEAGLLVVLGSRPQLDVAAFHQRLARVRAKHERLTLEPLTYSESYTLARRLATDGQWTEEEIRALALDAGGVPLFVEQVARYHHAADSVRPKTLAEVVAARHAELPPPARLLLEVVVIDEHPTPFSAALLATGQIEKDLHALSLLQAHRLVRVDGLSEATVLEPYHDRVRLEVLELIPTRKRRTLHEALARALMDSGASPAHVAEHFIKAHMPREAAQCEAKAATAAYRELAFERSAELYTRAIHLDPEVLSDAPAQMEEYAWALHQAGHCGRAAEAFVAASQCAAAERRHLLRGHAIEALLIAGEVDRGQAVLASLLPELRIRPVWRGFWGIVQLLFLVCLVRFKAQRLRFRARPDRLALQRAEVTWAAGKAFTNLLPVDGVVHLLRSLLFALDSGDEIAIARGLNLAASGYVPFLEGKSRRLLDAASSITQKHPTPYLLGMRGVALATAATMEGNWRTALAEIEGASKHLEAADIPTHWERSVLAVNRTACLEQLGHLGEAAPFFERAAMTARQRGDMVGYVSNWASVGFCRLVANDLAGLDHVIAEYARIIGSWRVGYGIWHTALWHLEVLRALRKRDGKTARTCFDAGWPKIVAAQLHHTRAMRLYLLETRAAVLLHSEPLTRGERRAWLREASRLRRQTADTNRRDAKPNALLLSASIAHFRGDRAACVASLESAAELYASEGMCEREVTVRWRIAALQEDLATQRALEERARSLGIEDLPTWAPIRTPGFWQRP